MAAPLPRLLRLLILCTCNLVDVTSQAEDSVAPAILVFGDSITAGNALPAEERREAWVSVLNREARGRFLLINEGKGGRPTNSVREFDQALARHPKIDALAILLGTNDSRDVSGQCVPKAVENLGAMIERVRRDHGDGLPILLIAPPNLNKDALVATKPIAEERDANLRALGDAYRELAARLNLSFASLYGVVPPETMTHDGVHPNAAGNRAIAEALSPELEKLTKRR
jgi:acyl-CoA thioesterase-1